MSTTINSKNMFTGIVSVAFILTSLSGYSIANATSAMKTTDTLSSAAGIKHKIQSDQKTMSPEKESSLMTRASYALGYNVGGNVMSQLESQGADIDKAELLAGFKASVSGMASKFTPVQKIAVMQAFQKKLALAYQETQISKVLANSKALLNNPLTPTFGPKNAKVTVVEFFDYQCVFCHKVVPVIEKIMKANPNVRYVFKEFPIFGKRWPASQYAAEMGLAVFSLKGSAGYLKYHNAIFATNQYEGKLTKEKIDEVLKNGDVDVSRAKSLIKEKKVTENLSSDMKLGFDKLGLQGTPAIIVMPTKGATVKTATLIPGFAPQETIQAAIDKASGKSK